MNEKEILENIELLETTNTTNTTAPSYPIVFGDYTLLAIGAGWILLCFLIFQFVRSCTRPKTKQGYDGSDDENLNN